MKSVTFCLLAIGVAFSVLAQDDPKPERIKAPLVTMGLIAGLHQSYLKPDDPAYAKVYSNKDEKIDYVGTNWHAGVVLSSKGFLQDKVAVQYNLSFYVDKFETKDQDVTDNNDYTYYHVKATQADLSTLRHTFQIQYAYRAEGITPYLLAGFYYGHVFDGYISELEGNAYRSKSDLSGDYSSSASSRNTVGNDYGVRAGIGVTRMVEGKRAFFISFNWMKGFGLGYEKNYNIAQPWSNPQYVKKSYSLNAMAFSIDAGVFIF
jgi:hypothetical protein